MPIAGPTDDRAAFVARYGGIYEHSPWVAEQAYDDILRGAARAEIGELLASCVDRADRAAKLALIRAHPDLAGRAAVRGELTDESSAEQRSAGIDRCTPDEYERFQMLNAAYKHKFGFPFVMAVRGRSRQEILGAFEARVGNDPEREFETAIREIHKIARLRLSAVDDEERNA